MNPAQQTINKTECSRQEQIHMKDMLLLLLHAVVVLSQSIPENRASLSLDTGPFVGLSSCRKLVSRFLKA